MGNLLTDAMVDYVSKIKENISLYHPDDIGHFSYSKIRFETGYRSVSRKFDSA